MGRPKKVVEEEVPVEAVEPIEAMPEEAPAESVEEPAVEPVEEVAEPAPAPEPVPSVVYSVWTVKDRSGKEIRSYTIEVHAERAEACAIEYAGKIGGSVVAS